MVFNRFAMPCSRKSTKEQAVALETFEHIHSLSMRYHITRKTGALSSWSGALRVWNLLRYLVFSTGPLVLELGFIGVVIFWKLDDWRYIGIILVRFASIFGLLFGSQSGEVKLRRGDEPAGYGRKSQSN